MGAKNRHHFAHHRQSDCAYAAETGIHYRAKEILKARLALRLPEKMVSVVRQYQHKQVSAEHRIVEEGMKVRFDRVDLEASEAGFRPDATGYLQHRRLFIEIRVTHAVDDQKRLRIGQSGTSCLEINLGGIDRFATPAEIESAMNDTRNSSWIFHERESGLQQKLHHDLESEYQALVRELEKAQRELQREQARKDRFKSRLTELASHISHRLAESPVILGHLAPKEVRASLTHFDETINTAFFELHTQTTGFKETVAIAWGYKQAPRKVHRELRLEKLPYCTFDLAPVLTRPPSIDEFLMDVVAPALGKPATWHYPLGWMRQLERDRREKQRREQAERDRIAHERRVEGARQSRLKAVAIKHEELDGIEKRLNALVIETRRRAEEIELARGLSDLSVQQRWASLTGSADISVEAFKHITPAQLDSDLQPLWFPYHHEWAYAVHPDYIKAKLLDEVIEQTQHDCTISIRQIRTIHLGILASLAPRPSYLVNGASSVALSWHELAEGVHDLAQSCLWLDDDNQSVSNRVHQIRKKMGPFRGADNMDIMPGDHQVQSEFLALWCQDLQQAGILLAQPRQRENDVQRFLYGGFGRELPP